MEWKDQTINISQNVAEWHQQEQLAYWKSRALSLEYENRMLHKHLRDVYAQQIDNYKYYNNFEELDAANKKTYINNKEFNTKSSENETDLKCPQFRNSKNHQETDSHHTTFEPPSEPMGKKRRVEMENLYGTNCSLIAGVETALQLNYEHNFSKLKPMYWPELQLNFGRKC